MRRKAGVLFMLVAVLTLGSISSASASNRVMVLATTNFFPSHTNIVQAHYWGVDVRWSTLRTQPTQLHALYSFCSPQFPGGVPSVCADQSDTGAAFTGVVPHHAFKIVSEVSASTLCTDCVTLPHHRTIASARLDVTVPFTEVSAQASPSFAVRVDVTWTACRRPSQVGPDSWTEIASGTLSEGRTVIVDSLEGFNAFGPLLDARPGGLAYPDAAALPLCPSGV